MIILSLPLILFIYYFFAEPGIKVDGRYYQDMLLKQKNANPAFNGRIDVRVGSNTSIFGRVRQQDSAVSVCCYTNYETEFIRNHCLCAFYNRVNTFYMRNVMHIGTGKIQL